MNTVDFPNNLRKIREVKGLSKSELARRVGVSDVIIGYWESGKNEPRMGKVELVASVLGVTIDELLFGEQLIKSTSNKLPLEAVAVKGCSSRVPLYGSIAAGIPLEMISIEDYIEIPEYIANQYPDSFLLKVTGDSMNKVVPNGAYALIVPCEEVSNGEVAAIVVNGYDATLKRFYRLQNTLVLEPDSYNPEHSAKSFDTNRDEGESFKIIGKMVWFMSPFNVKY